MGYAKGLYLEDYRGAKTVYHTGSSWGFGSVLLRFVDAGVAIAIACNNDNSYPRDIALRIADYLLAEELGPRVVTEDDAQESPDEVIPSQPRSLAPALVSEFGGTFYSAELDAIYRLSADGTGLSVRIEQDLPIQAMPVATDRFEFDFLPPGWSSPEMVELQFMRGKDDAITGFELSASTERAIVFEKIQLPSPGELH
jgi:hypothetical protein